MPGFFYATCGRVLPDDTTIPGLGVDLLSVTLSDMTQEDYRVLREIYPHLSDEELAQADDNLTRYVESTLRLYEAICADPERYAEINALTARRSTSTINHATPEGDNYYRH